MSTYTITVTLTAEQAAGLRRLCDKISHEHAQQFLYPHVSKDIRSDQAYQMLQAFDQIGEALDDAKAPSTWPWLDTGRATRRDPEPVAKGGGPR